MTLQETLKSSTRGFHDAAEGHNFQGLLAQALLPLDDYKRYLEQLFLVHSILEEKIRENWKADPRLSAVVLENQMQEPFLKKDLEFLKTDYRKIAPLPSTAKFTQQIEAAAKSNPISLLGFHYVLLGSKHGGKFIAKNVREKYSFTGSGAIYFDPYGDQFMPCWKTFINALNEAPLSDTDTASVIEAAKMTFLSIGDIGSELEQQLKSPV
jgi:heme oxygenase